MALINPLRYEEPLAPLVAARRLRRDTSGDLKICSAAFEELQRHHEVVLVEGVGGLLVPICESDTGQVFDCTHLATTLELPLVVVARRALGTINHTLFTCRASLLAPSEIIALLFCDAIAMPAEDIAAQTSPDLICELTGIPCWGEVPYLSDLTAPSLRKAAQQFITPHTTR
jgi:dethiobiotin synthetase